jgi:hypothetical protein
VARLKIVSRHSPGGTVENHEETIRIADRRGRDLNTGRSECDNGNGEMTYF